jgi:hypothetical protein
LNPAPITVEAKEVVMTKALKVWYPNATGLKDDLETVFSLWDAVMKGVTVLGSEVRNASEWKDCDTWLKDRR